MSRNNLNSGSESVWLVPTCERPLHGHLKMIKWIDPILAKSGAPNMLCRSIPVRNPDPHRQLAARSFSRVSESRISSKDHVFCSEECYFSNLVLRQVQENIYRERERFTLKQMQHRWFLVEKASQVLSSLIALVLPKLWRYVKLLHKWAKSGPAFQQVSSDTHTLQPSTMSPHATITPTGFLVSIAWNTMAGNLLKV
jgi:hypothetical protein